MQTISILHLKKNNQLIGVMTPDGMGLDHILYPQEITEETRNDVLRILAMIPRGMTLEQKIQAVKNAYTKEGYTVEDAV